MSLYAIKKVFIKNVSGDLLEDERLKAALDSYLERFKIAALKIGHAYRVVHLDEAPESSTKSELGPDWKKLFEVTGSDVLEADLSLVEGMRYELAESELILPFGYNPEEGEEYVEDMVIKVPFFADSKEGPVRVVTVNLRAQWEGESDRYKGPLNDFEWLPHYVDGIEKTLDIDEINLREAVKYSGKRFKRIPGIHFPGI